MPNINKNIFKDDPVSTYIWNKVYRDNQSCSILITGAVGTAKSYSSLRIAEMFDPDFEIKKQVLFTTEEFNRTLERLKDRRVEIMNSNLKPSEKRALIKKEITGKVVICDEGSIIADSLDFHQKDVKQLKYNLQSIRFLNLIVIFNLPVDTQFLKAARQLMHLTCETAGSPSKRRRLSFLKVYFSKAGLFDKYPYTIFHFKDEFGFKQYVRRWELKKPARRLWQPYERFSHRKKSEIAKKETLGEAEKSAKQLELERLILYNYTNKIQTVAQMGEIMEVKDHKVRAYIKSGRDVLKKLHNLKINAFRPY